MINFLDGKLLVGYAGALRPFAFGKFQPLLSRRIGGDRQEKKRTPGPLPRATGPSNRSSFKLNEHGSDGSEPKKTPVVDGTNGSAMLAASDGAKNPYRAAR